MDGVTKMLAQVENNFTYWANYGWASAVLFVLGGTFLYYFNRWWRLREPHVKSRLEAESEKEKSAQKLFDALALTEPQKMELLRQQKTLIESALAVQMAHAQDCKVTRQKVDEIHRVVVR
jgi:hypothetical protein